jgi:uncharacterized protein (DUF4415 family)
MPKPASHTDSEYVKRMAGSDAPIPYDPEDGPYDPNAVAATEAYLSQCIVTAGPGKRGPQRASAKQLVSLRLYREVLEHFRAMGRGWQTRMHEARLRAVGK